MGERSLISVAIIGGGPGGLGTAIALAQIPFLNVTLYEKNPEPRETGAGISLGANAWKVLDLLGASQGVKGGSKSNTHQRNAYNGKVLNVVEHPETSDAESRGSIRARRTRLQSALLARVPEGIIQFNRKLVHLEDLTDSGVRLVFQDQTEVVADLVVGADGIHSGVRKYLFPEHKLRFTGNTAWRVLIPNSRLTDIPEITTTTAWWWGESGHVYFSDVDEEYEQSDPLFEITIRSYNEPEIPGKTVGWGIPATNKRVFARVKEFDRRIRDAVNLVGEGEWWEFAGFAGPRLDKIIGWNKIALIGDASHPLSGAFGSGATFAMEDGWILARALEYTQFLFHPIQDALEIFDKIRTPYYNKIYEHLDESQEKMQQFRAQNKEFDAILQAKIDLMLYGDKDFIYKNDISKTWKEYFQDEKRQHRP
ncbi:FAD-binding monooxygenase [Penicillium argentinense]|uniref:FAD-binding monooxygenase n=1 Tax=Penicillium argentinense TaxID=1131581 RepID=A0A9W9G507_9EURO|nr:FAD-binding monooxygenase [Penicillium argentinense]KAJ5112255.1 FAD-binding monooxygenase [Penicillium argentinense]